MIHKCCLAVVLGLVTASQVSAEPLTFSILVEAGDSIDGQTLSSFRGRPMINAQGDVAFVGNFTAGIGLFTQHGLRARTGDSVAGGVIDEFGEAPVINNSGTIAFHSQFTSASGGGNGVLTSAVGQSAAIEARTGDVVSGRTLGDLGRNPAINNAGDVAFASTFNQAPVVNSSGIFINNAFVTGRGETIDGKMLFGVTNDARLGLNESGLIAFQGSFPPGSSEGIFTPTNFLGGDTSTIGGIALTGTGASASLDESGLAAFVGEFSGGTGVFTQNEVVAKRFDTIGGKILQAFGGPSAGDPFLNDAGTFVFNAGFFDAGIPSRGIFTQDQLLIEQGDFVEGKRIDELLLGPTINEFGDIAFRVRLQTGEAIIVGTAPRTSAVPEPSSVALFMMCAASACLYQVARRRRLGLTESPQTTDTKLPHDA